jgi:thiol-disulfide isomerase/thioredoxin
MRAAAVLLALAALALVACGAAARELKPWSGGATPPLALKDRAGREHRLDDYAGRVVVVNFWATWCEPCRDEMPSMQRLKERMTDAPFAILAVNFGEGDARVAEFLGRVPVGFDVLMDRDGAVSRRWQARVLPYTAIVDPRGRIRYTVVGELDWAAPHVEATLRGLLPAR